MNPRPPRVPLETTSPVPLPPAPPPAEPPTPAEPAVTLKPEELEAAQEKILEALKTCYDPEIPVNIYELGLIYDVDIQPTGAVRIQMTLTSPGCPAVGSLPPEVQSKVRAIPGVTAAKVEIVWDPPWTPDRMTEAARLKLGLFD
jgi:FeS assembly SUF system protein